MRKRRGRDREGFVLRIGNGWLEGRCVAWSLDEKIQNGSGSVLQIVLEDLDEASPMAARNVFLQPTDGSNSTV
jgi:hypothetical protein